MLENLNKYQILLASKSPRRRQLLEELRIQFSTISLGGLEETYPESLPAEEVPLFLANLKAEAYRPRMIGNELIITADTVVVCGGKVLGKPKDEEEAFKMLSAMSGKEHQVLTGVAVMTSDRTESFVSKTDVRFAELSEKEIRYYVSNFQPFDKAGAYGIQEWIGCVAVEGIHGSFYNVMGLPVHALYQVLKNF